MFIYWIIQKIDSEVIPVEYDYMLHQDDTSIFWID